MAVCAQLGRSFVVMVLLDSRYLVESPPHLRRWLAKLIGACGTLAIFAGVIVGVIWAKNELCGGLKRSMGLIVYKFSCMISELKER